MFREPLGRPAFPALKGFPRVFFVLFRISTSNIWHSYMGYYVTTTNPKSIWTPLEQIRNNQYIAKVGRSSVIQCIASLPMRPGFAGLARSDAGYSENCRRASASSGTALAVLQERAPVRTVPQAAKGLADSSPRLARVLFQKRHVKADSRTPAFP